MTRVVTAILLICFIFPYIPHAETAHAETGQDLVAVTGIDERFGIDFVNNMDNFASDGRYQQAAAAGAKWTRWPIYWQNTETGNGSYNYTSIDAAVARDSAFGLRTSAILMGTPDWASTSGSTAVALPPVGTKSLPEGYGVSADTVSSATSIPQHLDWPVFRADGSINPDNYWAQFVYTTVSRYKSTVKVWEIWNEPDFVNGYGQGVFWNGGLDAYYLLLKVGYLAVKKADPSSTVLIGGLQYWSNQDFFPNLLDRIKVDSWAPVNNYYFDVIPYHPYSRSYYTYEFADRAKSQMSSRGIFGKKIWINETNIPVCDDTAIDSNFCPSLYRGTMDDQASFIIQAYTMGILGGVDKIFIFQFYDDNVGYRDYYGLIRNSGSTRPSYAAYQVAATYLANPTSISDASSGDLEEVVLQGTPKGKVTVLWNKGTSGFATAVNAASSRATLVDKYGNTQSLAASGGSYNIYLPGSTYAGNNGTLDVGGSPYILVEQIANIGGTVGDNLGIPIPGATVSISNPPMSTITDGQGRYYFDVGGTFDISVSKAGYGALPSKTIAVQGPTTYNFNLPPTTDYVQNGGFEAGLTGWTSSAINGSVMARSYRHTGQQGAEMTGGKTTLSQTVNIPSGLLNPIVSYTYQVPNAGGNTFVVSAINASGSHSQYIPLLTNGQWIHGFFTLSGFTGPTEIRFTLIQGNGSVTPKVWLDEISVGDAKAMPFKTFVPSSSMQAVRGW